MLKNIVLATLSLGVTLGLYYEIGFFYGVFWVYCVLITLVFLGGYFGVVLERNRDVVEGNHKDMVNIFTSISSWVCTSITVPALLYTLITTESWNMLAMYVLMLGVMGVFLKTLHNKYKSMFSGEVK